MNEFKKIRYLSSEITQKGAKIYDLLGKESEIRVRQRRTQSKKEI